jgi:uncharacterized cupredoxin-like copper-binding protein
MQRRLTIITVFAAMLTLGLAAAAQARHTATVTINVQMVEYRFKLSKQSVPHGTTVKFLVVNKGKTVHDFKILNKKTPYLGPGKKATLTVTFPKASRLQYICTVPRHAELGMLGVFKTT